MEIPDGEVLYRRITKLHIDQDGLPTSFAFNPRAQDDDGVSLFAASHMSPDAVLGGAAGFGIIEITAADARSCGAELSSDPTDPAHVLLRVATQSRSARRKIQRALAEKSRVVLPPTL